MMKKVILFFLTLHLFSCSHSSLKPQEQSEKSKRTLDRGIASQWKANINFYQFRSDEIKKVNKAVSIIKTIINSPEFRDLVLNHTFQQEKKFNENNGYSNEEIYQIILLGAEIIGNQEINNTMDVELELYEDNSKTIGYTFPHTPRIWMNRKYFSQYSHAQVAGNLMHEWMHKLGFTHAFKWNKDREHSVPYAIGYFIEDLALKLEL